MNILQFQPIHLKLKFVCNRDVKRVIMSAFTILVICVTVILIVYYLQYWYSRRNLYKYASLIPGPSSLPLIGNAHSFIGNSSSDILYTLSENVTVYAKKAKISKLWLGPKLIIFPFDPDWIQLLVKNELTKDKDFYKFFEPFIPDSLVLNPVPEWKLRRKLLSPAFNQKHLDGYFDSFLDPVNYVIEKLSKEVGKKDFDVFEYLKLCTMDIISEVALDYKSDYQKGKNLKIVECHIIGTDLGTQRQFKLWLHPDWLYSLTKYGRIQKEVINYAQRDTNRIVENKLLQNRKKNMDFQDEKRVGKSVLDIMIENHENGNISSVENRNGELIGITVAGSDTTSTSSSFVLMILGYLPHIQEKVFTEIYDIFGNSERPVTKEDLSKMKYLECVIKETMRLFPAVPFVARHVEDNLNFGKYTIPAGSSCGVFIYQLHRDVKIWGPDADEFNPDRFSSENLHNIHPFSYLPFSAGSRDCLGKRFAMMSMKIMISQILRKYEIFSKVNYKNVHLSVTVSIRPTNGHLITIKPRRNVVI